MVRNTTIGCVSDRVRTIGCGVEYDIVDARLPSGFTTNRWSRVEIAPEVTIARKPFLAELCKWDLTFDGNSL